MNKLLLPCLLALLHGGLHAQTVAPDAKKSPGTVIDAAKRLLEDKGKIPDDTKKKAADAARAVMENVPDDLKAKAKGMLADPKAAEARSQAINAVKSAVKKQQGADAPAPETAAGARQAPPAAAPPEGPQPQRLKPLVLDDPKGVRTTQAGQTVITATKSAFFDAESAKGLYIGNVHASHPQMIIDCDELEIHMQKQQEGSAKKQSVAIQDADIIAGPGSKKPGGSRAGSGIDMAYARGSKVTIEKRTEEGELQIAHCNEVAIYDGKTEIITLRGWPSVQRGNKLIEATDPRCYMIIDQKGRLEVKGIAKTTLIDESSPAAATPGTPVNGAPPVTPAATDTPASQQR